MPTFKYKALDMKSSQEVTGNVEARDPADAVNKVRRLGVFPTFVREVRNDDSIVIDSEANKLNARFCEAVWNQNAQLVAQLIDSGADVNCFQESGNTPLHLAVEQQDIEMAKRLLSKGADPNKRTEKNGWTPLMHAVDIVCISASELHEEPDNQIITLLLESGADPNATCQGTTALQDALKYGNNPEAVALLQLAINAGK